MDIGNQFQSLQTEDLTKRKVLGNVSSLSNELVFLTFSYLSIKNRLLKHVRKTSKIYKCINEDFDVELFQQMVKYKVFDRISFVKLVDCTYYWIHQLQMPIRDKLTAESKMRVLDADIESFITTFINEVNTCLDILDFDIHTFFNQEIVL